MTGTGKWEAAPFGAAMRVVTAGTLILLFCVFASSARANQETALADISMTPVSGKLFHEAPRPVDWRVEAEIRAPWPESNTVVPMKRIRVSFPKEMSFNPDPDMPVCPDSKVGPPPVNLSVPPRTVIARCPHSLLGNGTSQIYLARKNHEDGPDLMDGQMLIFNGGWNRDGSPRIKVYGFSALLATGLYLEGTLSGNLLEVDIGYLPADSAVGKFDLNIPGADNPFANRRGRDPRFVRATCATGSWNSSASFTLGTRDSAGDATGPETVVDTEQVVTPCEGAVGRPKLRVMRAKRIQPSSGPRRAVYVVRVRNRGTATARGFRLQARGRSLNGVTRIGRISPGAVRAVRIVVKRSGPSKTRRPLRPSFRLRPPSS